MVLAVSLSACSGLTQSDKPATKTWWLEPYTDLAPAESSDSVLLLNVSVTVVPGLDTDQILTLSDKAQLNSYSAARWAENLPELLSSLSERSLESSGRFEVVSALEQCNLDLELQEFFADLNPSGQTNGVRIAINGRYQCENGEVESLRLNASIPVLDESMSVIVSSFQQAMDRVMKDLLETLRS